MLVNLLAFVSLAECLLEKLSKKNNYTVSSYVPSDVNTVHYVQSELKEYVNGMFVDVGEDFYKTQLTVYRGDPENNAPLHYLDRKNSETNTFFFTTSTRDQYHLVFSVVPEEGEEIIPSQNLSIDIKVYSGEANRPGIVSNNDVEVSRAENLIRRVLEFVKQNIMVQEMDEESEAKYRALYEKIMKKVFFVLALKICATGLTMYYSSRKTKSFYASQGFIADK